MDLTQIREITQAITSLTTLVTEAMDSKMQIWMFGEIKQALESLTTMVTSAMEVSLVEIDRDEKRRDGDLIDEKRRDGGPDWERSKSMLDRARERVRRIISDSTYAHPICLRCGGKGHLAKQCCGSIVCFACEKTGHRSRDCTVMVQLLKPQHKASFDNNHRVLSFTLNFHIGRDVEYQRRQHSQWIWKRKEVQEQRKGVHQEEALKGGEKKEPDDSEMSKINDAMVEMPVMKDNVEMPVMKALAETERKDSSVKTKAMVEKLVQMNLHGMEAKEVDYSEVKEVACSRANDEGQKEMQHGLYEAQKENKEEQEANKENNSKEIAIEDKVEGQSRVKAKKGKSKKEKKGEGEKKWLLTKDDQGKLVFD